MIGTLKTVAPYSEVEIQVITQDSANFDTADKQRLLVTAVAYMSARRDLQDERDCMLGDFESAMRRRANDRVVG